MSNPHETRARARKVEAIVAMLDQGALAHFDADPYTPDGAAKMATALRGLEYADPFWSMVAKLARVNAPSIDTRGEVIAQYHGRAIGRDEPVYWTPGGVAS